MQSTRLKFTYRDYLLLPEGDRRELIEGDFYLLPTPSVRHQIVLGNLAMLLWDFIRRRSLGQMVWAPTDVVLSSESVVQPDILFISNERRGIITEDNVSGAPDLVVEILSPSTAERDRELKLTLYARYGVREYWIVDPEDSSAEVLTLEEAGVRSVQRYTSGRMESPLLPGLRIALDEVFASD